MIRSMTGFGRGEAAIDNRTVTIEIKSVNHRYCDINIRMPRKLMFLENLLKNQIKEKLLRGKIDVFINYEDNSEHSSQLFYNKGLADQYVKTFIAMSEQFKLNNDIAVSDLARFPEVLKLEEQAENEELLETIVFKAMEEALGDMLKARMHEGQQLKDDLMSKLDDMEAYVGHLVEISPQVIEDYRNRLNERLKEWIDDGSLDQDRLAMEVAMFADKSCVDEEIVRLKSHVQQMQKTLDNGSPVGRKLDFIAQEMNREANTILSKANHLDVANQGIELKSLIEMIREQIQNIE